MKVSPQMADTLDTVIRGDPRHPQARPETGDASPSDWPDDRAAHPQGLDRPEERGRQADRGQLPRASGAARWWTDPEAPAQLEQWLRSYQPEELFDENGTADSRTHGTGAHRRAAASAPTRTPTADCSCASCALPDFRDYADVKSGSGRCGSAGYDRAGRLCPRCHQAEHGRP